MGGAVSGGEAVLRGGELGARGWREDGGLVERGVRGGSFMGCGPRWAGFSRDGRLLSVPCSHRGAI